MKKHIPGFSNIIFFHHHDDHQRGTAVCQAGTLLQKVRISSNYVNRFTCDSFIILIALYSLIK